MAPLLVIVSILIGASLLGVLGALVAIPVAAALQIIVRHLWRGGQLGAAPPDGEIGEELESAPSGPPADASPASP